MRSKWYYASILFEDGARRYICQFDSSLERSVFSKKEDSFIKLKKIRWVEYSKKRKKALLVKLENVTKQGYTDSVYVKRKLIDCVWPLKNLPVFGK